ncbi:STAS domain-containing protein [Streptomyces sp. NPDC127119]|uniref:STAS domain-containing protein n=1 Tax=Streptomyces sp. NPDC127119 TaxID=3345370 RepID=UPI0036305E01
MAGLTGVTFMDSRGVDLLAAARRAARDAQRWLRVAGVRQSVRRVIELVGVDARPHPVPPHPASGAGELTCAGPVRSRRTPGPAASLPAGEVRAVRAAPRRRGPAGVRRQGPFPGRTCR